MKSFNDGSATKNKPRKNFRAIYDKLQSKELTDYKDSSLDDSKKKYGTNAK